MTALGILGGTDIAVSGLSSYSESIETTAGTAANTILLTADDYSSRSYTIVVTRQALVQVTVEANGAAAEGFDPSYAVQGTAVAFTVTPADDMSIQSVAWKTHLTREPAPAAARPTPSLPQQPAVMSRSP